MAEGTGVEPVRALTSTVFKTVSVASYRIDLPLDLRFWIYDLRLLRLPHIFCKQWVVNV